ncbi:ribonuclease R [Hymenobacter busanensis]|uniref:Ribonuclease R n=1 Tax=Hymenobacter busanensis TaxID=2607656 RepID=A0A7L4ZYS0_9BACT|nr:ribonuclease R [Hymenobacter busanensis]KAA9332948.1 ribonuclease R [Hymenobacter busanensis]QHJ08378.1 ribonuclease R [Hymenobacter busanensis]
MKRNNNSDAPRPQRDPARRRDQAAPSAVINKTLVFRIFADNPGKVFNYRQLARRLGVVDKEQRESLFDVLKSLKKSGHVALLQNDDYRLVEIPGRTDATQRPAQDQPADGGSEAPAAGYQPRNRRPLENLTEQQPHDPIVHRRRSAGFDMPGPGPERNRRPGSLREHREQGSNYITGTVDLANTKFAFIVSDELPEDLRVFTDRLAFAMDGDTVKVRIGQNRDGKPTGDVVEVLERVKEEVVGRIQMQAGFGFVQPDYKKLYFDVFVPPHALGEAQNGDKVVVKITEWPTEAGRQPVGEVVRTFGPAGGHEAEINAIMAEYGLPFEFPEEVEKEADAIPASISPAEIAKRRDFRPVTTFTIDPVDAKDFDDALSLRTLDNGHYEIGVHIADVTHYVLPGTRLEKEAKHRATSVYLVDRTIPMLPERLSNGLCSLRPHEDKLTFSAVFELDEKGKLYDSWFGRTVIHSDRRFTYEEAQERIESGEGDYADDINLLNRIAKKLQAERFRKGAISFEAPEVKFKLDEEGKPVGVFIKERKDAHKLIEEFMLLANRKVADYVFRLKPRKPRLTMVYRTHDAPDPDRLENFAQFARQFGHSLNFAEGSDISKQLNQLTAEVEGKPEQSVIQALAVRSMSKAIYTTEPLGHFGLAFDHYSHFTSPIRRYPDMMAHRLLEHYLHGGKSADVDELEADCKHSSEREKRAAQAERASIKYKQVEFMAEHVGEKFTGVVSGLTEWGMYVEMGETKSEGMARLADIPEDFFELDKENLRVIGRNTGRIIRFGDKVEVIIKAANLLDRTIDLELVTEGRGSNQRREGRAKSDGYAGRSRDDRGPRGGSSRSGDGSGRPGGKSGGKSGGGKKGGRSGFHR